MAVFPIAKKQFRLYIMRAGKGVTFTGSRIGKRMKRPDKAFAMTRYLEEQLLAGAYSSGARMPSLRTLMRKFGVSYGTARRGMFYLCEKYPGIGKESGRGTYFTPEREQSTPAGNTSIIVFCEEKYFSSAGLYFSALKGITSAAQKEGVRIKSMIFDRSVHDAAYMRELTSGYDGAILLWQYDAVYQELDLKVPAVGIMMENSFDGSVSTVDLDPCLAAKLAVRYFKEHGIKTVKILSSMNNAFLLRGKIFAMLAAEEGIRCFAPVEECTSYRAGTGYLFTSDEWAHAACLKYQESCGRALAAEHRIMGMDGKQLLLPEYSRFPTVAVDWEQIGAAAYNECTARIRDPRLAAKKIFLSGWFVNYPE